jgi:hypothetical protein
MAEFVPDIVKSTFPVSRCQLQKARRLCQSTRQAELIDEQNARKPLNSLNEMFE